MSDRNVHDDPVWLQSGNCDTQPPAGPEVDKPPC